MPLDVTSITIAVIVSSTIAGVLSKYNSSKIKARCKDKFVFLESNVKKLNEDSGDVNVMLIGIQKDIAHIGDNFVKFEGTITKKVDEILRNIPKREAEDGHVR